MSPIDDLRPAVAEYRAGLEAEIAMLHQLAALAEREREVTAAAALSVLDDISDARDRIMASLVAVESQLKPIRRRLLDSIEVIRGLDGFHELAALHREAAGLAAQIVADRRSLAGVASGGRARAPLRVGIARQERDDAGRLPPRRHPAARQRNAREPSRLSGRRCAQIFQAADARGGRHILSPLA